MRLDKKKEKEKRERRTIDSLQAGTFKILTETCNYRVQGLVLVCHYEYFKIFRGGKVERERGKAREREREGGGRVEGLVEANGFAECLCYFVKMMPSLQLDLRA